MLHNHRTIWPEQHRPSIAFCADSSVQESLDQKHTQAEPIRVDSAKKTALPAAATLAVLLLKQIGDGVHVLLVVALRPGHGGPQLLVVDTPIPARPASPPELLSRRLVPRCSALGLRVSPYICACRPFTEIGKAQ